MKAVILAGGKGTRLTPYTMVFPKPLVPIGDRPVLDIVVKQLAFYGFDHVILSVGHLGELIQTYFQGMRNRFDGVTIVYYREPRPLGTAGALALIPGLTETFLAMNGDVLTTLDYCRLVAFHKERGASLTIAMHKKEVKIDLGILQMDHDNNLTGYTEKPTLSYRVSMGIYVYEPTVLSYIERDTFLDFPDLVLRLLENKERVSVYPSEDFWLDIGRLEDYQRAVEEFEKRPGDFHAD